MAEPAKDTTVIGSDTHVKGELTFKSGVRLMGTFEGRISGDGELQVSDGANCRADVESASVVVDGTVEGNLHARDKLQLNAKGVVKGDIVAGKMVMTEGASFFGQCAVGPDAVKGAAGGRGASTPGAEPGAARTAPQAHKGAKSAEAGA